MTPGTDIKDAKYYNAISVETQAAKTCSEKDSKVYTVIGLEDVLGNKIQKAVPTDTVGGHTFKDQINWSEDGKKATVTRTCQNSECLKGYNTKPLVADAKVTMEKQEDGSYLYTATLDDAVVGTKKVYDLRDAKWTVNGGEAVDENVYDWSVPSKTPTVVATINGVEISSDLYELHTGTKLTDGDVLIANKIATVYATGIASKNAYGEDVQVKYNVLGNTEYVVAQKSPYYTVASTTGLNNGDDIGANGWYTRSATAPYEYTAVPTNGRYDSTVTYYVQHVTGLSAVFDEVNLFDANLAPRYDGKEHVIKVTEVIDKKEVNVTRKTTVKYAVTEDIPTTNISDLEFTDSCVLQDAGLYYVYVSLEGENHSTAKGLLAPVSIYKNQTYKDLSVKPSVRTMEYGSTVFSATTGETAVDEIIELELTEDMATLGVGIYYFSELYETNGNYQLKGAYDNTEIEVKPRSATIVLSDKEWEYTGVEVDPQTLYTVDGVLPGDNLGVVVNTEGNRKLVEPGTYTLIATANNANYTVAKSTAIVTIKPKTADQAAAQTAIDAINGLTATSRESDVKKARDLYDGLTPTQKAIVSSDTLAKLASAEAAIASQTPEQKSAIAKADTAVSNPTDANIAAAQAALDAAKKAGKCYVLVKSGNKTVKIRLKIKK
jgi:hypothetical protein